MQTPLNGHKNNLIMNLESPKITVSKSVENVYDFLSDVKNFEALMPDNISKFELLDDDKFVKEIFRVLKPGGKLILTTPNLLMSLSRNPWHIREYRPSEMKNILRKYFHNLTVKGVYGNDVVMEYYSKNKESVSKITRFDIFNLQYIMPRWILKVPYDILNRFNRNKLKANNESIVDSVKVDDYLIQDLRFLTCFLGKNLRFFQTYKQKQQKSIKGHI